MSYTPSPLDDPSYDQALIATAVRRANDDVREPIKDNATVLREAAGITINVTTVSNRTETFKVVPHLKGVRIVRQAMQIVAANNDDDDAYYEEDDGYDSFK